MPALRYVLGVALLCAAPAAHARVKPVSAEDKLQAACYPDVQRLCKDAIPDEGKIRACMEGKKSMISEKCMKAYKESKK